MIDQKTINRLRRITTLIKANAERASPGVWWLSHSHVIAYGDDKNPFDVACQPWLKEQSVYRVTRNHGGDNMRHIATCNPMTMLKLVADIETLLAELNASATSDAAPTALPPLKERTPT